MNKKQLPKRNTPHKPMDSNSNFVTRLMGLPSYLMGKDIDDHNKKRKEEQEAASQAQYSYSNVANQTAMPSNGMDRGNF